MTVYAEQNQIVLIPPAAMTQIQRASVNIVIVQLHQTAMRILSDQPQVIAILTVRIILKTSADPDPTANTSMTLHVKTTELDAVPMPQQMKKHPAPVMVHLGTLTHLVYTILTVIQAILFVAVLKAQEIIIHQVQDN